MNRLQHFTIIGGLTKPFYQRFRELRKKHDLTDREMVECLILHLLKIEEHPAVFPVNFDVTIADYRATPPSEMAPLPEVTP